MQYEKYMKWRDSITVEEGERPVPTFSQQVKDHVWCMKTDAAGVIIEGEGHLATLYQWVTKTQDGSIVFRSRSFECQRGKDHYKPPVSPESAIDSACLESKEVKCLACLKGWSADF